MLPVGYVQVVAKYLVTSVVREYPAIWATWKMRLLSTHYHYPGVADEISNRSDGDALH